MSAAQRSTRQPRHGMSGIPVDAGGGPTIDPTENVKDLMDASIKSLTREMELQARISDEKVKRMEDAAKHLKEVAELHQAHDRMIHEAEKDRLNSIRQIDVSAVKTEADRNLAAIQTLATQQATNAETLRMAVANTATTIANTTAQTVGALSERIAALEKSSYEGVGKQRVSDPLMDQIIREVQQLRSARSSDVGKSEGIGASWGVLLGVAGLAMTILSGGAILVGAVLWLAARGGP